MGKLTAGLASVIPVVWPRESAGERLSGDTGKVLMTDPSRPTASHASCPGGTPAKQQTKPGGLLSNELGRTLLAMASTVSVFAICIGSRS
jgi:hypothetical protein